MICSSLLRHAPGRHLSAHHGPMNAVSRPRARAGLICKAGSSDVTIGRRQQLIASLVAYPVGQLLFEPAAAHADVEPAVRQYVDPQDSFQVAVPSGWLEEETKLDGNSSFTGSSGARRTMIWYSPDMPASEVNVTLTITNTSAEFTRLGRYGLHHHLQHHCQHYCQHHCQYHCQQHHHANPLIRVQRPPCFDPLLKMRKLLVKVAV